MNKKEVEKLKPIKTISGEILLFFYLTQRRNLTELKNQMLNFGSKRNSATQAVEGILLHKRKESFLSINEFKNYTDNDLYNALNYLYDSGLIDFKNSKDNTGSHIYNLKLTSHGVDMIEGIEMGDNARQIFNTTFNFSINNDVTIESLLKAELGSLIKGSLF